MVQSVLAIVMNSTCGFVRCQIVEVVRRSGVALVLQSSSRSRRIVLTGWCFEELWTRQVQQQQHAEDTTCLPVSHIVRAGLLRYYWS